METKPRGKLVLLLSHPQVMHKHNWVELTVINNYGFERIIIFEILFDLNSDPIQRTECYDKIYWNEHKVLKRLKKLILYRRKFGRQIRC